jgi:anti-sigma factor RsiW
MQCADLERYLEAFLDSRLGRTRTAILRRHLAMCPGCRAHVDKLRQFESDLQRRLRFMQEGQSVWAVLDADLVRSTQASIGGAPMPLRLLPPPVPAAAPPAPRPAALPTPAPKKEARRPRRRRLGPKVAGLVLVVVAVGAFAQAGRVLIFPEGRSDAELRLYLDHLARHDGLPLESHDPSQLQSWLAAQTGIAFPRPPSPEGFQPVGARIEYIDGRPTAVVAYESGQSTTLLYFEPAPATAAAKPTAELGELDGLTSVRWSAAGFDYSVLSPLAPTRLGGFAAGMSAE